MSSLQNFAGKLARNILWPCLSLLPKKRRKVLCQSFHGRGYSDSPKAIADELLDRGWEVLWAVKSPQEAESLPVGVRPVLLNSPAYIYHMCTAGVWVDNCRKWGRLRKRSGQLYVQTWHGFPLKRIERDAEDALAPDYVAAAKKDSALCDLLLSNSAFLTEIYRRAFWYGGEVLECGFPRNDCLFASGEEAAAKVRRELGLPEKKKLLLYAPTFRKDQGLSAYDLDYRRLAEALSQRFGGEWLVLAKLHPNIADKAEKLRLDPRYVVNASPYPDIQELYLACGALVTDYSSVMFDYMNTGKPSFLYVNDLETYRGDRNFYFDLDLLPFARAEDNARLAQTIRDFDAEAQSRRVEDFREKFGILEDGRAAQRVADWLEERS
ncbi:glycerophosphotransferase [Acutalibacter sp. 1XD8-33]|uniref:CDP-glycerol glycerophosphotransferase family protein n=1 Tax=Acutalibacter sp. 1XD8-33 TaxID=2320081 RepID=UPI000EA3E93D|nr:CDP-glycerol glycerophosphotransferase family protein [Acutalibacter sp. 1XD8-33]RKJ40536.1 glycerophosphotransferase [Acutalibacter sp. 1XD8-33]